MPARLTSYKSSHDTETQQQDSQVSCLATGSCQWYCQPSIHPSHASSKPVVQSRLCWTWRKLSRWVWGTDQRLSNAIKVTGQVDQSSYATFSNGWRSPLPHAKPCCIHISSAKRTDGTPYGCQLVQRLCVQDSTYDPGQAKRHSSGASSIAWVQ